MSSRRSRKTANPRAKAPEPIITRTKSRQLRNKEDKKPEEPELTKPETKSTKVVKTVKRPQQSLLKLPIVVEPDDDIQEEYYPNMLKRDVRAKKIMLKPKHNFKVIAATNKRKLATPQKGTKPPSKQSLNFKISAATRPELSMQDMVRMMDETRSLSDEDFMEILTCPSPVWWEDPPDGGFDEDSIHTRLPEPPPKKDANQNKKRKLTTNTAPKSSNNRRIKIIENDTDLSKEKFKIKDEKFSKKKQKLENILGNIKKKTPPPKNDVKNDTNNRNRKLSESEGDFSDLSFNEEEILKNLEEMEIPMERTSTESEIPMERTSTESEISMEQTSTESEIFMEQTSTESEISMEQTSTESEIFMEQTSTELDIPMEQTPTESEIPIEQTPTESYHSLDIKSEIDDIDIKEQVIKIKDEEIIPKNENIDREILSIEIKKEIKEEFLLKSPVYGNDSISSGSEFNSSEEISFIKKSDEIFISDSCTNSSLSNLEDSSSIADLDGNFNYNIETKTEQEDSSNEIVPTKKTKDLSEFITVYKITPDEIKDENDPDKSKLKEKPKTTKIETVRGKLNDFFKKCKSNMRLKKMENATPAIPLTDVKETTDNENKDCDSKIDLEDDKKRLKSCDYCIEKTENGTKDFSCEKCATAPILSCGLCNFVADTKEVNKNHVSSCKDVARISWSHNYVLNQT